MHDKPVALTTGANQGIGLQMSKELAHYGYAVLLGARDLVRGMAAAETVGGDVRAIQLDVTDRASVDAAAALIRDEFGHLEVLVNNAAISNVGRGPNESVEDYSQKTRVSTLSLDELRAVFETNVLASSPSRRRCCRFCGRPRRLASSTCPAERGR